jgi:AcrR family transcriptional regulator
MARQAPASPTANPHTASETITRTSTPTRRGTSHNPHACRSRGGICPSLNLVPLPVRYATRRTGVAKTTIYRRWRSREELALAVVLEMTHAVVDAPWDDTSTGSELVSLLGSVVAFLGDTPMRTVMRGLASEVAADPRLGTAFRDTVVAMRRDKLARVVQDSVARGELRQGIDVDLLHDFLFGPVYYRLLVTGMPLDDALPEQIVDAVLTAIAAAAD